jgi:hypothetical protein
VVELWEEVTQVWVATIMAAAHTSQAERMAQEQAILLATACDEAVEAAQMVSILEYKLMATRQARDVAEEKLLSLMAHVAVTDHQWEAGEDQCGHLAHKIILLSLKGSELCMTITDAPPLNPYTRECALQWPYTPRWPHGSPRFGRRCPWSPSPYSGACPLMSLKQVLWERWSLGFGSEQSGARASRLLA